MRLPPLNIPDILLWCDDFRARHGRYPTRSDGRIVGQLGLRWRAVDACLKCGFRSLPGRSSLARLMLEHRQRRHKGMLPALSVRKILAWLDAFHARHGRWPNAHAGKVPEAPGETFRAVEDALNHGGRGLPGGSSITRLLAERRNVRNRLAPPGLSVEQVLTWADRHRRQTGKWPSRDAGPVAGAKRQETWVTIDVALRRGTRGLPRRGSLARLLEKHRAAPNRKNRPPLTERTIVRWARAWRERTGKWPTHTSGEIPEAKGTATWSAVQDALQLGGRGLPGGDSLYRLLLRNGRKGRSARAKWPVSVADCSGSDRAADYGSTSRSLLREAKARS
jgi:hypothetical protein